METRSEMHVAREIADQLMGKAYADETSLSWECIESSCDKNMHNNYDFSLSSGVSGILLFYAELYNHTKDNQYLEIIEKGVNGLIINLEKKVHFPFGFMNGITGIVFLFIKLYIITSERKFRNLAEKYSDLLINNIDSSNLSNSLFDGRAGALVVLLDLFLLTKNRDLLNCISRTIRRIMWDARYDKDGLTWYHSQTQASGLISFGYGSVGISYALTLSNIYTYKDDRLKTLFGGGFDYCFNNWNQNNNSVPDYNIHVNSEEEDILLIERVSKDLEKQDILLGKNSLNLPDGLLGVLFGLSFIGDQMNFSNRIRPLINTSISNIKQFDNKYLNILDLSALLLIANLNKEDVEVFEVYRNIKYSEDELGLTNGLAGRGYLDLIATGKVLNPFFSLFLDSSKSLENSQRVNFPYNEINGNIFLIPYKKHYSNTLELLSSSKDNSIISEFHVGLGKVDFEGFRKMISEFFRTESNTAIRSVFRYEDIKHHFYQRYKSGVELYVSKTRSYTMNRSMQKLSASEILNRTYVLSKNAIIVHIDFDFEYLIKRPSSFIDESIEKEGYVLLHFTDGDPCIREEYLTDLNEVIINFEEPLTGRSLLNELLNQPDMRFLKRSVREQIVSVLLNYVQSGVLELLDSTESHNQSLEYK